VDAWDAKAAASGAPAHMSRTDSGAGELIPSRRKARGGWFR
jgi:hypothetical protein